MNRISERDSIYLTSDGFGEPINPNGAHLAPNKFRTLLKICDPLELAAQRQRFIVPLERYQDGAEQWDEMIGGSKYKKRMIDA